MSKRDFLPDYSSMSTACGYRPMYKLFVGANWRVVPQSKVPGFFPTASQAINAAKEYVRARINPTIRAEQTSVIADALGVAEWRQERAGRAARDQEGVLGAIVVKGRQVVVERRRARA
jgi:hypothetical protein